MNSKTKAYIALLLLGSITYEVAMFNKISQPSFERDLYIEESYGIEKFNTLKEKSIEEQKQREIERLRLEAELKRLEEEKNNPLNQLHRFSRGEVNTNEYYVEEITFEVSFYSDVEGSIGGGTHGYKGDYLQNGDIALPKDVPYMSKVVFEGNNQVYTKKDVGGAIRRKNGIVCVDVFKKGYTTEQLNKLGKYKTKGYIFHKK